ncbi:MAG TPA: DUF3857 and transglutaminase domain-containing protein [Terriglobales bacterium]|nr:DUF3857 and transglutaminase domain-containing protein [Terriglobales bacterium]
MHKRNLLIAVMFCAVAVSLVPTVWAGDAWPPLSADDTKMTAEPKAPGAPAIFLYRQVDRDDTTGHEVNFARIKILTEEGRKYADVEIPFVKGQSQVRNIKARAIQSDGAIAEFNGKVYEKTVVKAKGVKFLAKTFTLPDVRVGTIIDYSYTNDVPSDLVYDSRWILSEELFTKNAKFSLKPSTELALQWSWPVGLPQGTKPPAKDGAYIRLETSNVPAFLLEDFMPPENTLKYRVEFTYSYGDYEKDPVKFWKNYNKRWYSSFNDFTNKHKAMEQTVAQIVAPDDTPEVKLQKIYARVLQIRNTSFEREKTEQEAKRAKEKDVNNVEDVLKRGYGDAGDINWLFIALAKACGIEAYSVRVSSRSYYFFDQRLMNANQLNTDVVLVKLGGKDLYLDPGAKFAPYGLLPWYETKVQGLLLDKENGQWVTTDLPNSALAKTERKAELTLSEDGTLEGTLTMTFGGLEALELRTEQRDEDDTSRKTALEDMVKESVPVGADVELTNKPDWTSSNPTLVAEYHVKVPGWVSGAGRRALFPVGLFGNSEKHTFEHADRVYNVYFHHPYLKSDEINITLPLGWSISSLPNPVGEDGPAVGYILKSENRKGSLHISRTMHCDLLMISQAQYGLLRQFFQMVRTGDEQQVVLQPTS